MFMNADKTAADVIENPSYTVPADINVALLHTVIAITALRDVLIRENETLDMYNSRAFMDLQEEKIQVARRYETLYSSLMSREADLKGAAQSLKDQLARLETDFSSIARSNAQKLDRVNGATRRLGEFIMDSARKAAETQNRLAYGAHGKFFNGGKASIGFSERA